MSVELKIPALPLTMEKGRLAKWFVKKECLATSRGPTTGIEVRHRTLTRISAAARACSGRPLSTLGP